MIADEKRLDVLHDHYKDTFARLREAEKLRDRLFIWVIIVFALLALEIGYPLAFRGTAGTLDAGGGKLDFRSLPLPALLDATWVLTLALVLRYCQTSISVDRQYRYVHLLEDTISPLLGGNKVYRREGEMYLSNYPMLLNVAWIAYVIVFPLLATIGTVGLLFWEAGHLRYRWFHTLVDGFVAGAIVAVLLLYRVLPYIWRKWNRWRSAKVRQTSTP